MATKEELSEQLAITNKLNVAIQSMASSLSRIERSYESQVSHIEKLNLAINQINSDRVIQEITKLTNTVEKLTDSMAAIGTSSEQSLQKMILETGKAEVASTALTGRLKNVSDSVKGVGSAAPSITPVHDIIKQANFAAREFIGSGNILSNLWGKKFPKRATMTIATLSGFSQGIKNVLAMTKSLTGFFATFVGGLTSIAASIIAIPLKLFTGLVDMAAKAAHGSTELLQAYEDLRKEFGNLRGPTNKTIIGLSKSLKGFHDTGLSTWRVFGRLHERLNLLRELVGELGGSFHLVRQELVDNGGAILAYQKGLGIANEEMGNIILRAQSMGVQTSEVLNSMTKQTLSLGKAFGISQKVIGKDMAKAMNNVAKFGGMAVKEIAAASVYARKLGLELEKITGALDFDNFEDAADAVSQLSQRFGTTIDTFKLLDEENPAARIDMIKKALQAAGHDAASFNRHDLKLVASLTKVDEAAAKAAFSVSNQGVALGDVQKESEKAEKKQMSQTEAMGKLAASIERLVKQGGPQMGSFWDQFVKGMITGLQYSKEFRRIIINIKKGLYAVFREGMKLGRILPKIIPDLGKTLGGIADFFDPRKFKKLFGGIAGIVRDFFASDGSDKLNVPRVLEKLKNLFIDFFTVSGDSGRQMTEGFKGLLTTMGKIVEGLIPEITKHIVKGIGFITDLISGKIDISGATSIAEGGLGFFGKLLSPILKALRKAWPKVWAAFKDLWAAAWPKIKKSLISIGKIIGPYIAVVFFGPILIRTATGMLITSLSKVALASIKKVFGPSGVVKNGLQGAIQQISKESNKLGAAGGANAAGGVSQIGNVNKAAASATKDRGWGARDAVKLGLKLVAIAGAIAIGGVMMAGAIALMKITLSAGGINNVKDAAAPLTILGAMVLGAIPMMVSLRIARAFSPVEILKGSLAVGAAVGVAAIIGGLVTLMLKKIANPAMLKSAGKLMIQMSLVFLAMIPLITAATMLGAAVMGPQAIALVATAAGFGIISMAVMKVAVTAQDIIKEVSKLSIGPDFQVKLNAFLGVMKSLQAFADTMVSMIKLMTPSITEIISGTAEKFSSKIGGATLLLGKMIGQKNGKTGIIGIVEVVMKSIKDLSVSKDMESAANTFSSILGAVAHLLKAISPPDSFYEAGGGFIRQMSDGGNSFANLATDSGYYVAVMQKNMVKMLKGEKGGDGGLLKIIEIAAAIPIPNPEEAKIVVQLLSSMAQILEHLIPKPDVIKSFQTTTKTSSKWGLIESSTSRLNVSAITSTINAMGRQMRKLIPALKSAMSSIVKEAKGLNPKNLKAVSIIGDILSAVASLAGSISESVKGKKVSRNFASDGSFKEIINSAPDLGKALSSVKNSLPDLVKSIIDITKIPGLTGMSKKLNIVKDVFEMLGTLPALAALLQKGGAKGTEIDSNATVKAVGELQRIFGRLVDDEGVNPLEQLLSKVNIVGKTLSSGNVGAGTKKISDDLTKTMSSIKTMLISAASVAKISKTKILKDGLGPIVKTIQEIVGSVNELNDALADGNLNKLNIQASLKHVAKASGLGGSANYTIKNKGVNITINMKVTMNAEDLEKAMVLRASSIIRDRLRIAGQNPESKFDELPTSNLASVAIPGGSSTNNRSG